VSEAAYYNQDELWGNVPDPYQLQVAWDILHLIPSDVSTVLDAGCGDGIITNALPNRLSVVGLDISPTALKHLRRQGRVGSITELPYADSAFDLVMTTDVVEHLSPALVRKAVAELTRVARKYVIICVPNQEQRMPRLTRCGDCGFVYHIQGHQRMWDETALVGLLPASWKPLEVRYSGQFRTYDDEAAALRLRASLWHDWPHAVCPECGSKERPAAVGDRDRLERIFDCLTASQWWANGVRSFGFSDRSEVMTLYARDGVARMTPKYAVPDIRFSDPYAIDFKNPLQAVTGLAASPRWPRYIVTPEQTNVEAGVRVQGRDWFAFEFPLSFPVLPHVGDEFVLEIDVHDPGTTLSIDMSDALGSRRVAVESEPRLLYTGSHRLVFRIGEHVTECGVGQFGMILIPSAKGTVTYRRAEYHSSRVAREPGVPWMAVSPGHHVVAETRGRYVRSWGYHSTHGGMIPAPAEAYGPPPSVRRPAPAAPETRKYYSLVEQEISTLDREMRPSDSVAMPTQTAEAVRNVIDASLRFAPRRGRRVLVLSHMFPTPTNPGIGPFIHEQVAALRVYAHADARVVCCLPYWVTTRHPLKAIRAVRAYRRAFQDLHWDNHDGVPVLYLPYVVGGLFRHPLHSRTYSNAVLNAAEWIRNEFEFEIVHAHTSYLDGEAGVNLAAKYDVPVLITEHTGPFSTLTDHWYIRRRTVRSIVNANKVFCVSAALAADVTAATPAHARSKIEVLHNGVDTTLFQPPLRWKPDPERPKLVSVISLDDNKNPMLLLKAFERLLADVPGARLSVVGQGPLRGAMDEYISARKLGASVTLLGYKNRNEISRLMRESCDLFVLPSNSETFGVVIVEALASGKPCVSTDCGGPRDTLTSRAVGRLCPPRDPEALYRALRETIADLPSFQPSEIRRYALDRFDYINLASRLADEYELLLGTAPAAQEHGARRRAA
jgi:glycosyltransferase involved in cell wall biosynthesis